MPIMIILSILALIFTIYIGYRISSTDRKLFSISLIALFSGLIFESYRISKNWKIVIFTFVGSYILSLTSFLPGKREKEYIFENHIEFFPYAIIFLFALFTAAFNKEKTTAKVTEGITLIQSLSLIYLIIDYNLKDSENWFLKIILVIAILFSLFSIFHSLTYLKLSKTVRLTLSVWSTIIMFAFAIINIYNVYQNEEIENSKYISQGLYIVLQYFLLGVSAIYIAQNYMLLVGFLPSRNGNYKNELTENKKDHLERFSENQVNIKDSIFCILYAIIIYGLNFKYNFLPSLTMIWLVFFTFPLILNTIENKKNYR